MRNDIVLETQGITKRFRGLVAVDRFDIAVRAFTIHSLIGPNGAGKTTVFNVITGIYRPEEGKVLFQGQVLNGLKPHEILARGIARTFQNPRLFKNMTCLENTMAGQHAHGRAGFWSSILRLPHQRREEKKIQEQAGEWLHRLGLWPFRHELARNIPYGCQKLLELARALAAQPKVLLLDEPTCGLNESEKATMMNFIEGLPKEGITVLLVEHNMNVVMGLSDLITVMNYGKKIAEGTPEEIYNNPVVVEAYLGRGESNVVKSG
ncbi:MAG: ABC transporter ATP-binding protein [Candidatus Bipolaricaulota bacterium]|nr:ABC transporter ATP-binding protein [Candidatus Bipolaricaulota bacterium]MDW8126806.1 ABC transporter ATP-binding protein [Candidatus Bipolaricaulota bacterium]